MQWLMLSKYTDLKQKKQTLTLVYVDPLPFGENIQLSFIVYDKNWSGKIFEGYIPHLSHFK